MNVPDIDPAIARLEPETLSFIEEARGYPYTPEERAAVLGKFIDPQKLTFCSRCDLPLEDCEGHGSTPESEDNEAEESCR